MRSQVRASYVARAGNGSTPASRRFSEEVPPVKLWAEAVAVLAAGLSAIVRNPDQASTIAMATLHRAGEAVPTIMRSPEIRASLAIAAATLAEDRGVITQPAALPVASTPMATPVPLPTVTSLIPTSPPSPAPAAADLLRHDPPAPLGVAELRARITMLEQRRAAAQARGTRLMPGRSGARSPKLARDCGTSKDRRRSIEKLSVAMDKNHAAALKASSAEALLKQLGALGCKTAVSGDRLVLTPGGEQIPPRLLMELRKHKSAAIELLKQRAAPPAPPNSAPNRKPSKSGSVSL